MGIWSQRVAGARGPPKAGRTRCVIRLTEPRASARAERRVGSRWIGIPFRLRLVLVLRRISRRSGFSFLLGRVNELLLNVPGNDLVVGEFH